MGLFAFFLAFNVTMVMLIMMIVKNNHYDDINVLDKSLKIAITITMVVFTSFGRVVTL